MLHNLLYLLPMDFLSDQLAIQVNQEISTAQTKFYGNSGPTIVKVFPSNFELYW